MSADLTVVKGRQQQTWSAGDYARVGNFLVIVSENLCEAVDLHAGQPVLDVATGSGITALAAARRFCPTTGIDYVPALVEQALRRAEADQLTVDFQVGDAEALVFPDGAFDVVLSTFGVMFTANQEQAARELLRVCRPGGKIGLANWTPEGYIGGLFRTIGKHVPPPAGVQSPLRWGTEDGLRALLGDGASELRINRRYFNMRFESPQQHVDYFRTYYGPTNRAFAALDAPGQEALERDFLTLIADFNQSGDATVKIPSEYLEVVAIRA